MIYRQFHLTEVIGEGAIMASLVCWLPDDERLKEGRKITLEEIPDREWVVWKRYQHTVEGSPRKTWKVGGLG